MPNWIGNLTAIAAVLVVIIGATITLRSDIDSAAAEARQYRNQHGSRHEINDRNEDRQVDMLLEFRLLAVRNEEKAKCQERISDLQVEFMRKTRDELSELQLMAPTD